MNYHLINSGLALINIFFVTLIGEFLHKKFFMKKKDIFVFNRQTDDGENITLQVAVDSNLTANEKADIISDSIRPIEARQKFVVERFQSLLEEERAKQAETSGLKSV